MKITDLRVGDPNETFNAHLSESEGLVFIHPKWVGLVIGIIIVVIGLIVTGNKALDSWQNQPEPVVQEVQEAVETTPEPTEKTKAVPTALPTQIPTETPIPLDPHTIVDCPQLVDPENIIGYCFEAGETTFVALNSNHEQIEYEGLLHSTALAVYTGWWPTSVQFDYEDVCSDGFNLAVADPCIALHDLGKPVVELVSTDEPVDETLLLVWNISLVCPELLEDYQCFESIDGKKIAFYNDGLEETLTQLAIGQVELNQDGESCVVTIGTDVQYGVCWSFE